MCFLLRVFILSTSVLKTQFLSEVSKRGLEDSKDNQARETCKKSEGKKSSLGAEKNIGKKKQR